ncbi:gliding motility-associated C-terminal domain-containing protein [Draconibacterium sp. IB214405]|uniref:T9SS type B sorting domain-containing protein n=1 Tax=Draconibacterium sp. IB214405 TaxID=3097352 RepID=UPI002A0E6108|nr:T9SS type B sorting domain-containing protein [Draconibacterium sp. IB214405]MDX8339706.1 gliding motility-associated C-terminal domain-containing protein [Draconibacterium sp. IB214405]
MQICKRFLVVGLVVLQVIISGISYSQNIQNLGFENGNFDGWVGYQWRYSDKTPSINTPPSIVSLPTSRRHVIISDRSAYDSNTGGKLKMVPDGYKYSARLGDEINQSTDGMPRCWHQSLQYTMKVDSSNAFLLLKYACVLQYSTSHDNVTEMEPRFQLNLLDENGDSISSCVNYEVYSESNIEGFQTYSSGGTGANNNATVKWRDWTTVGADLTTYIGQEITIEFLAADCTGQYHYGYAYFVVDCMPLYITVDYCQGDNEAILEGPDGFESYSWSFVGGEDLIFVDTTKNLVVTSPNEGDTYLCEMQSETGCEISLSAEIVQYNPIAAFEWKMKDCKTNEVEFINQSTNDNKGTLSYLWDLGDTTLTKESFTYKFKTSGWHEVGLIVYNPPSGCTDTVYQQVESFSPPLVGFSGDTVYCKGQTTTLTAYGADNYEWSTGSTAESITVGAPGGTYWMLGYSSEGCVSDTNYFTISEDEEWSLDIIGDTILCVGDSVELTATGAYEYLWNTQETSDAIIVAKEGTYSVTGYSEFGCSQKGAITLTKISRPELDVTVTPTTINKRHNTVDCLVTSDDAIEFYWDMGDGTEYSTSSFPHTYSVTSDMLTYTVNVTGVNEYGCTSTQTAYVTEELFVPNVFTPNNDGVNDAFLAGFDVTVFDRHGIILFTGNEGWDGYYNGKLVDPDTYFYKVDYLDAEGETKKKQGFITLVR